MKKLFVIPALTLLLGSCTLGAKTGETPANTGATTTTEAPASTTGTPSAAQ